MKATLVIAAWLVLAAVPLSASGQEGMWEEGPHLLTMIIGGTHLEAEDETAFTLGLDYEYRVNELIGVGGIVEYAFDDIDTTTILAVVDIHIWRGLAAQIGPGVEIGHETLAVGRFGALYELEVGQGLRLIPQIHYDASEEHTVVFGVGIGKNF